MHLANILYLCVLMKPIRVYVCECECECEWECVLSDGWQFLRLNDFDCIRI